MLGNRTGVLGQKMEIRIKIDEKYSKKDAISHFNEINIDDEFIKSISFVDDEDDR